MAPAKRAVSGHIHATDCEIRGTVEPKCHEGGIDLPVTAGKSCCFTVLGETICAQPYMCKGDKRLERCGFRFEAIACFTENLEQPRIIISCQTIGEALECESTFGVELVP